MMEHILKVKTITDNLAAIGEPIIERDQILQILGGLGHEYNSIVASLTSRDEDLSLHFVHSILLTHEQRLQLHQSLPSNLVPLIAHVATTTPQYNNMRPDSQYTQTLSVETASSIVHSFYSNSGLQTSATKILCFTSSAFSAYSATMPVVWQVWSCSNEILPHV